MGGVIVDSGPIIYLERGGYSPRETLAKLQGVAQSENLSVSAVVYTQLLYGIYRAESPVRKASRHQYISALFAALDVGTIYSSNRGNGSANSWRADAGG